MTRRRLLLAGGVTAAAVGVAALAVPLVTGGYDSATEALLRDLHRRLLVVAVPLALIVQAALFYAAYTSRASGTATTRRRRWRSLMRASVAES